MPPGDAIDEAILRLLQRNARISRTKLAAQVGLSRTACVERIKKLEDSGTIVGYKAITPEDRRAPTRYLLLDVATIQLAKRRKIEALLKASDIVLFASLVTGTHAYVVVIAGDKEGEYAKLFDRLARISGVEMTNTVDVIKPIK